MGQNPVGIVLDFKRKRVVTVMPGDPSAEKDLADALKRQLAETRVTNTGVAPPPPEQLQQ